jgi:hypothetical protein
VLDVYRPFDKGVIFDDTQRGVKLSLLDFPHLPACKVTARFARGRHAVTSSWDVTDWRANEVRTFATGPSALVFDPGAVEVTLAFAGTAHRPRWDLFLDPTYGRLEANRAKAGDWER